MSKALAQTGERLLRGYRSMPQPARIVGTALISLVFLKRYAFQA
jgi:hypothetical protein